MSSLVSLGDDLAAHASGALWVRSSQTLVIADIHLGYGWAQRRRGELGPLADTHAAEKLFAVFDEFQPRQVVFLGDIVHAPRPSAPERAWIEETLQRAAERTAIVVVRGNHDRAFAREFGCLPLQTVALWQTGNLTAAHGDRLDFPLPERHTLLLGHLHPSLPVRDAAGAAQKLALFLHSPSCVVLPAFSPFASGFDVSRGLPLTLAPLFRGEPVCAIAATGKRAAALGTLEQALARLQAAGPGSPSQFRMLRRRSRSHQN